MSIALQRHVDEAKSWMSLFGIDCGHPSSSFSKVSLIVSRHSPERSRCVSNNAMILSRVVVESTMVILLHSTGLDMTMSRQCPHTARSIKGMARSYLCSMSVTQSVLWNVSHQGRQTALKISTWSSAGV